MSKRTYQPKKRRRQRVHGFMERMMSRAGRNVLKRRQAKGRQRVAI
jgi:large subunit ribosomal protein L34